MTQIGICSGDWTFYCATSPVLIFKCKVSYSISWHKDKTKHNPNKERKIMLGQLAVLAPFDSLAISTGLDSIPNAVIRTVSPGLVWTLAK